MLERLTPLPTQLVILHLVLPGTSDPIPSTHLLPSSFHHSPVMEKTLSTVPVLSGRENYKEWAVAIKGAAYWSGFWPHYVDEGIIDQIAKLAPDADKATKMKFNEKANELGKLELKAQGALMMTVSMVSSWILTS
jgi:hypothetical protein